MRHLTAHVQFGTKLPCIWRHSQTAPSEVKGKTSLARSSGWRIATPARFHRLTTSNGGLYKFFFIIGFIMCSIETDRDDFDLKSRIVWPFLLYLYQISIMRKTPSVLKSKARTWYPQNTQSSLCVDLQCQNKHSMNVRKIPHKPWCFL